MTLETLVGVAIGVAIGLIFGAFIGAWLRKMPNVNQLTEKVADLQRRFDELQHTAATQQQMEQVRSDLSSAQTTLAQVDRTLQTLTNFTQNNLEPLIRDQLQQALNTLVQIQQALHDAQGVLSDQSQSDQHRHTQLVSNLQTAQESLSSLQTLLNKVSEDLRSGQQGLNNALGTLQTDVSVAKEIIQNIAQQVGILEALRQTAIKVEENINRLTSILTGRRSGQAGEQIVSEALKYVPDDWLARNIRLGKGQVEFALKMPGGYLIPLDSKFVASELVAQLEGNGGQQHLLKQVSEEVRRKAKEVAERYLTDPNVLGFGIAVVPDSAYDLCRDAVRVAAESHRVVVVPYSLLLPYVLSLYLMAQRLGIPTQLNETKQIIGLVRTALEQAKQTLENRKNTLQAVINGWDNVQTQVDKALRELSRLCQDNITLPGTEANP